MILKDREGDIDFSDDIHKSMMLFPAPRHNDSDWLTNEAFAPRTRYSTRVDKVVHRDVKILYFLWLKEICEGTSVCRLYIRNDPRKIIENYTWVVFTDGSSNSRGSGSELALKIKANLMLKVSTCFKFYTTNN